jgi:hypothetical protein
MEQGAGIGRQNRIAPCMTIPTSHYYQAPPFFKHEEAKGRMIAFAFGH